MARAKFISGSDAGKSLEEDGSEDWLLQPLLATLRERRKVLWYNMFLQKVSCFDVLMSPDVCVTLISHIHVKSVHFYIFHPFILFPPVSALPVRLAD